VPDISWSTAGDRGLQVDPFAHAWKDVRQFQNEMVAAGHAHECLRLIRQLEEPLGGSYWNDVVFLAMNHKDRDMHVTDREIRTELVKHQLAHRKNRVMRTGDIEC